MPTAEEHIKKARYNEGIAKNLIMHDGRYLDWAVIILFYSALQYVDAYLAHFFSQHPSTHYDRRNFIMNASGIPWTRNYYYLYNQGRNARYLNYTVDYNKLTADILPMFEDVKVAVLRSVVV